MLLPAPVPSAMTAMARIRISARPYPVHCSQCHVAVAATGGLPSTTKKERSANRYQFVNAVEEMIRSADSEKRQGLAHTIDAYHGDCPEESNWAASGQVPALLHNLMLSIDTACRRWTVRPGHPDVRVDFTHRAVRPERSWRYQINSFPLELASEHYRQRIGGTSSRHWHLTPGLECELVYDAKDLLIRLDHAGSVEVLANFAENIATLGVERTHSERV
jgi:hypothetical protein